MNSQLLLRHFNKINRLAQKNLRTYSTQQKLVEVQVNSHTGVSTITLQRPPVNTLSLELINDLLNAILEVERNKGRGLIITSTVPGVFSAGLDLREFYKPNIDRLRAYWTTLQDMWLNLYSSSCPTVAAINGHSPGGGCLIATCCDYRIMVQGKHTIGLNEAQWGLAIPFWFVDTFRNVVSRRTSETALITGKLFTVDEALEANLIDEIATNSTDCLEKANLYISSLAKLSMTAMAQTKLTLRYNAIQRLQDGRENDLRVFLKFINSPEIQRGLQFSLEKLKKRK